METCAHLEKLGWARVTYLPVNKGGLVLLEEIKKSIKAETVLVSIMYVNNEVGTIQSIAEIGQFLKKINKQRTMNHKPRIFFHTDATQAIQYLDCDVNFLGVDFLSLTGHKIYAPKGIGALYIRKSTPCIRQQDGGGQERGLRAGTENVPFIVALGSAVEKISKFKKANAIKVQKLRDLLIKEVLKIPGIKLTGHPDQRAPHIASFMVEGVEGEALLLRLSEKGIMVSSGSACSSSDLAPSHVLTAMGYGPQQSHGSLRFSLSQYTTREDIKYVSRTLPEVVEKLRKMAPKI